MAAAPSGCEDRWLGDYRDPAGRQAVFFLALNQPTQFGLAQMAWPSLRGQLTS